MPDVIRELLPYRADETPGQEALAYQGAHLDCGALEAQVPV